MLRIATSGWFTIGVWKSPASLPALVTVNVEPRSSSAVKRSRAGTLGEVGNLRRELVHALLVRGPDDGHDQSALRLHCDADVVAVEVDDRVAVEARVELRKLGESLGARPHDGCEQSIQRDVLEVALLDPGHRRDLAVRTGHVLRDQAPHAAQRLAPSLSLLDARNGANVVLRDASAGPGAFHRREIDPELLRDATHDRRRLHARRLGARRSRARRVARGGLVAGDRARRIVERLSPARR